MPTLYGVYRSRALRNLWLARELGIELEHVPVMQAYRLADPHGAEALLNTASPAFLAISPAGAIPVLVDDKLVLSESLATNLSLARKQGGPLAPADASENALMEQWALYGATSIEPSALAILYTYAEGRSTSDDGIAEIVSHVEKLKRPLAVLESRLQKASYIVGSRFTVADINMAEIVRYGQGHAPLIAAFPAVGAWLKSCQARPAFQAMWARRNAEPA